MRRLGAGVALALLALAPAPGRAGIPSADKISEAVAANNRASGRAEPLWVDVKLHIGDSPPLAEGTLASHPTGLARLELSSPRGFVERHLLQGETYTASRDGRLLAGEERPFLPPVFLLQATSGAALRAALESYGVDSGQAVLGRIDEHDCYVLGGRAPRTPDGAEAHRASVWVDVRSLEVVRIDRADGVRFRLGPFRSYDGIRAPSWIRIEVAGQPDARLDLERVARANAPAAAFSTDWLTSQAQAPTGAAP